MSKIVVDYGNSASGGGITADLTRELGSITSSSDSYTTTEDCVMIGTFKGSGSMCAGLYLDSTSNILLYSPSQNASDFPIGYDNIGMCIPKGHTILARNSVGTYNVHFYAIARS